VFIETETHTNMIVPAERNVFVYATLRSAGANGELFGFYKHLAPLEP